MRLLRVVLALVFGLAMAGPETHACPVHTPTPGQHHQDTGGHQQAAPCTCPQACCPSGVSVSLPTAPARWNAGPAPVFTVDLETARVLFLPTREHLLPFALGPPHSLA